MRVLIDGFLWQEQIGRRSYTCRSIINLDSSVKNWTCRIYLASTSEEFIGLLKRAVENVNYRSCDKLKRTAFAEANTWEESDSSSHYRQ